MVSIFYISHYANKSLVKYVDIGATYYFNKNMSTYVDYKINLLDNDDDFYKENGIATDDIVAVVSTQCCNIQVLSSIRRCFISAMAV